MRVAPDVAVRLRPAGPADRPLLERWDEAPHVLASDPNDDWQWAIELARSPAWREQLIAEVEGRPIGFVQIIDPAGEETRYWGEVPAGLRAIDLWIGEADDLGKGYGTRMMQLALERCFADAAVSAVLVDPLAANTRAHRFYERLGFHLVERRRFGADDCLVYRLERPRAGAAAAGARRLVTCAALFVAAMLAAGAPLAHEGDGAFADNGAHAPHSRYVLDLGPVDLGKPGRHEYRFGHLPGTEFAIGLRLAPRRGKSGAPPAVAVRVTLENEKDELVVHAEGRLADWLWSEADDAWFVYQRGQQTHVAVAPRATRPQRIGLRADGGWGTYFTPRTGARYRLVIDVARADAEERPAGARLLAVAGGWK
jgi:aminoglycoside 6'-N-acetyltransferase